MIELTIDGLAVAVPEGTTLWEAARSAGIEIPTLCHDPRVKPAGVCRMCVVDTGGRVLAASCVRACEDGMEVKTKSELIDQSRAMLTELLMSDQPAEDPKETTLGDNELHALARRYDAHFEGSEW